MRISSSNPQNLGVEIRRLMFRKRSGFIIFCD
ncbi:hypothetical protein MHA_1087 [Mannheimia haemolytica PHL213]|nr:hypothetical protein MHA_1087 [Mannheimia haemolytica PHL213]